MVLYLCFFRRSEVEIAFKDIGSVFIVGGHTHPGRVAAARRLFPFVRPSGGKHALGYLAGLVWQAKTIVDRI